VIRLTVIVSVIAILGSARGESHTQAVLDAVLAGRPTTQIDLRDVDIQHYEYGAPPQRDDFYKVIEAVVDHTHLVLATPVYWYSMSGRMKVFIDRLTDLVTPRQDLCRQLQGLALFVVACGVEVKLPSGFEVPFRETAGYLDMTYGGIYYAQTNRNGPLESMLTDAADFGKELFTPVIDDQPSGPRPSHG